MQPCPDYEGESSAAVFLPLEEVQASGIASLLAGHILNLNRAVASPKLERVNQNGLC